SFSGFTICLGDTGTKKVLFVPVKNGSATVGGMTGATAIVLSTWHHCAFVFDQGNGNTCTLYVNGTLDTAAANTAAWAFNSQVIRLSTMLDTFWARMIGYMAEVGWWNVKLSAGEIAALA